MIKEVISILSFIRDNAINFKVVSFREMLSWIYYTEIWIAHVIYIIVIFPWKATIKVIIDVLYKGLGKRISHVYANYLLI